MSNTKLPQVVQDFIASLKDINWFGNHGDLPKGVLMFETRKAAQVAARDAEYAAAWEAAEEESYDVAWSKAWTAVRGAADDAGRSTAWDAAWGATRRALYAVEGAVGDAGLYASYLVAADLPIPQRHVDYIKTRWAVWQAGYGVYGYVERKLYCYKRI